MTEIIQNEAQRMTIQTQETFEQYKERIFRTRHHIRYKTGEQIELDPTLQYTGATFSPAIWRKGQRE